MEAGTPRPSSFWGGESYCPTQASHSLSSGGHQWALGQGSFSTILEPPAASGPRQDLRASVPSQTFSRLPPALVPPQVSAQLPKLRLLLGNVAPAS